MYELSDITRAGLEAAGWFNTRNIDITEYECFLKQHGYEVNDVIKDFLKEFGGLYFDVPYNFAGNYDFLPKVMKANFDVCASVTRVFPENVHIYERATHEQLVPVGSSYDDHMDIFIAFSEKIYSAFDANLFLDGDNGWDFIEGLFIHRKGIRVPVPEMEELERRDYEKQKEVNER